MNIVSGNQNNLPQGIYSELSVYRHEVFVEMLGWQLDTPPGIEQDQFDRPDTVYVVAKNDEDCITGCARLLPTTQPYLLGEVFPELLNGMAPPCADDIWELSRFAAVDVRSATGTARAQLSSPIAVSLLQGAIRTAAELGAKRLITVSPIGIERLLRHAGFRAHRAGPPMVLGGHPLFACWIEIDAQ
ncbi:MAG TPA: acyl-homoserine-lactone synthase [Rhodocyclaceae bacterium]|nr:acyl-homoserine-lactone synthase [Rhodocyclaceae bacterium]